jgi:hypothetical protein
VATRRAAIVRLHDYWYVACRSEELGRRPLRRSIFGMPLALFRDRRGPRKSARRQIADPECDTVHVLAIGGVGFAWAPKLVWHARERADHSGEPPRGAMALVLPRL